MGRMTRRADQVDVRVGKRVRSYRLARGMSQTALGEKVGVTFQQIQKYESGANRIGSGRLKKIANVLGLSIVALFGEDESGGGSGDKAVDKVLTEVLSQPDATRLMRAFDGIKDRKQRRALVLLAESMARGGK
jgi:transcriptional regulator with XRE-family HTH domain